MRTLLFLLALLALSASALAQNKPCSALFFELAVTEGWGVLGGMLGSGRGRDNLPRVTSFRRQCAPIGYSVNRRDFVGCWVILWGLTPDHPRSIT